jgi:hypothetical protein
MPKGVLKAIMNSELKSGKDIKKAESIAYGVANKKGWMHGSKETDSGKAIEKKYEADHKKGK